LHINDPLSLCCHDRPDGKISISVEEYTESSEYYKFVIADDGKGIDPQQQKRIFNIFQTLDSTKSESTGIGLAIVKKIVESQGGSIWVESDLGKGSAFSFTWH
jgi:signal transduction histidine kinase